MNNVVPYHKGVLIQRGRCIGGIFSSLFRTLAPIGKAVVKSAPKILKTVSKSKVGKHLKKSAKRIALNTAKDLIQSGDINKSLRKSVQDSKKELVNVLNDTQNQRKRKKYCNNKKAKRYHFMK